MRYADVELVSNDFSRGEKKPRRSGARIAGELKRVKAVNRVLAGFKRALLYCYPVGVDCLGRMFDMVIGGHISGGLN